MVPHTLGDEPHFQIGNLTAKSRRFLFSGRVYVENNRDGQELILQRLDRCYANDEWRCMYPDATVCNHSIFLWDHSPIILELSKKPSTRNTPYKLEAWSLGKEKIKMMVCQVWEGSIQGSQMFTI